MQAAIISVGDELVSGLTVNTNASWISAQLTAIGIKTAVHMTTSDFQPAIVKIIRDACALYPIVLISGGLGPTDDDLTRAALAEAMNEKLVMDHAALDDIRAFFAARKRPMPSPNNVQAQRPESATCITNTAGTAPGLRAALGKSLIWVMPGVPREMKTMFERDVLPDLKKLAGNTVTLTAKFSSYGMGESQLGEKIKDLMVRGANPSVGTTVHEGIVSVRVYATGTPEVAAGMVESVRTQVYERLGPWIYGQNEQTLEQVVTQLLMERKETVATAESCTGGLVAKFITDTAGSSAVFHQGFVTYSNEAKAERLGIDLNLINQNGAVSEPVAIAMAERARAIANATYGIGVTGIAGPDGGTPEKPVGTIWIAIATPTGTRAIRHNFFGQRQEVRLRAAQMALARLRWHMLDLQVEI